MRLLRIVKSSALRTLTVWIKNGDATGGNSCLANRPGRIDLVVFRFQKSHNVIMINDVAFLDLISAKSKDAEHGKLIRVF
jgi:hypothetical protein